jgi:hypothetical protein
MSKKTWHADREYYRGPDAPDESIHTGFDTVAQAIARRKEAQDSKPEVQELVAAPKTQAASLEWEVNMTATALSQYERRMKAGEDILPEEMRVFLSLLNTMRQLKLAMSKLQEKDDEGMGPVEIALGLVETGMTKSEVLALYPDNPKVKEALK